MNTPNQILKLNQMDNLTNFIKKMIYFAILITTLAFCGCAVNSIPTHVREGREYGKIDEAFRHKWWNYYKRGLSFAEGEYYKEAEADLREAMGRRMQDQRMARTYGMHFIDYFPHRELGIVHYLTQNFDTARKELELSLNQFPSAKARFYLDRVRKAIIGKQGKGASPPSLTLDFKTDEIWTRLDPVFISGTARDENYISEITIRGTPLFSEGSQKEFFFRERLALPQGRHEIEITAQNLPGRKTTQKVIFHIDREGPTITIEAVHIDVGDTGGIKISGSAYDDAGVSELSINGQSTDIRQETEIFFTESIMTDKSELELSAKDRLGNRTTAKIPLNSSVVRDLSQLSTDMPGSVMLASAASDTDSFFLSTIFGPKDKIAPDINLKGWTDTQTVFLKKIYLEGKVSDESKIVSLGVNGTPILRREGQLVFFGHLAELSQGKNEILIEARDEAGNTASKKISVTRKIPKALELEERLSITVLPFEQSGEVSEFSVSFQDNLINALVNQNRFRMIERTQLDMILREQKLSRTKLIDRNTALKLGNLIAARSILTGSIVETRTGIEIVARMIDTETSEILATQDVYNELKDLVALKTLSEGMAIKFHRDFPLVDGLVIQQKGDYIFIDLGQDMVKLQRRFIAYREEPIKHPVTGKILGSDNVITGYMRVTQVTKYLSKAKILDRDAASIKPLDKVIAE